MYNRDVVHNTFHNTLENVFKFLLFNLTRHAKIRVDSVIDTLIRGRERDFHASGETVSEGNMNIFRNFNPTEISIM